MIKEELYIPLVAVWTSTGAEAFDFPPLSFLPSSPKTLSAVTLQLLRSTVMPEIYDAWSGNMMEPHSILEAMLAVNQFSSAQGLKILTFHDISMWHTIIHRGELIYLAPLGSENISAPYFKQCFFRESNTTPPIPKTEITNILFYILNFASIIKFKM